MQGSTPQTFSIADFLKWNDDKELRLNPKFQRGSVWTAPARTYLIDSILRGYPIPKLLLRTTIDRDNRRTLRDVVDGQQRLRTIIDFASGRLVLGSKANEFQGYRYNDLDDDLKDSFLAYKLTCEQLINASDEDVLEVFVRVNSYAVAVSEAELRNARFDNPFTDAVKEIVSKAPIWELGVVSLRDRVRMVDQSTVAEVMAFADRGVTDGAETDITRYYKSVQNKLANDLPSTDYILNTLSRAHEILTPFRNEPIIQRPHFLMFVAALLYADGQLPAGKLSFAKLPEKVELAPIEQIRASIAVLNAALESDGDTQRGPEEFREARSTTQRTKSRQTRLEFFVGALQGSFGE